MQRDIKERDLLRLGAGERELDTDSDFSKLGRVNATLARRLQVLGEVDRLGASLSVSSRLRMSLVVCNQSVASPLSLSLSLSVWCVVFCGRVAGVSPSLDLCVVV